MRVDFDPRLGMTNKILNGTKTQTTRKRRYNLYSKLHLWATWRAMKKGLYCTKCFREKSEGLIEQGKYIGHCFCEIDDVNNRMVHDTHFTKYPRKLLETRCIGNRRIRLAKWEQQVVDENGKFAFNEYGVAIDLLPNHSGSKPFVIWAHDEVLDPFAKDDGFETNKDFVTFFRKYLISHGWEDHFVNRWKYPGVKL